MSQKRKDKAPFWLAQKEETCTEMQGLLISQLSQTEHEIAVGSHLYTF